MGTFYSSWHHTVPWGKDMLLRILSPGLFSIEMGTWHPWTPLCPPSSWHSGHHHSAFHLWESEHVGYPDQVEKYFSFGDRLPSLSVWSSSFPHVIACVWIAFWRLSSIPLGGGTTFFTHPSPNHGDTLAWSTKTMLQESPAPRPPFALEWEAWHWSGV